MANTYRQSDGTRITQSQLDRKIRQAKAKVLQKQLDEQGYISCVECGRTSGDYLDCAHIISVDKCKKSGQSELAYSVENIRVLCRTCHQEYDKNHVQFQK